MFGKILKLLTGFVTGAAVGAVVTSMFIPKSGSEFRDEIRNGLDEIRLNFELGRQKKQEDLEAELKRRWGEG